MIELRTAGKWSARLSPLVHLSNNWASLAGVVVVTTATIFWLFLLPTTLRGEVHNPYIGILAYLLLPAVFFLGLVLIPLGIYVRSRREHRHRLYPPSFPPLNLKNVEFRRLLAFVGVTTFANIVIASQLTYGAVSYMETVSFCGQTCHTVMQPEFTAYQNSPHSRVECVQCHIGPGESWFVRSKLSGIRQVFAVAFHTYDTPIPTPVTNLRPARETCETCHWPQKYGQDRLEILPKFADDEKNSLTKTVLLLKIGGGNKGIGIHGTHLGPGVRIRYGHSDTARQTIPWIEYDGPGGKTVYRAEGAPADGKGLFLREMDCMDCHNRPSHSFKLPERAVDEAMFAGELAADLPFARKKYVEILRADYPTRAVAASRIPAALDAFYRENYPAVYSARRAEVLQMAQHLLGIYNRNVFPEMKITWGTYPNNIGHTDFPGCFRCHDDSHASADGRKVTQDCNACHNLLAMEDPAPKVLTDLGIVESKAQK
jgi:nitrate/TMAO reductase-like tetraheme cytochrome c subunit